MATSFQKSVWKALEQIPKGKVTSYGAIANYLDSKAVRAVGSAVGKNPSAPAVPCHRVVLGDGKIGHYSGGDGVSTKIKLLADEGVDVKNAKVLNFKDIFWAFK
ncbi:MAG TPA: MGMT family protein [Sulfurovum sp.]|nr:MGMT family protein [Sulfurovum sp.]